VGYEGIFRRGQSPSTVFALPLLPAEHAFRCLGSTLFFLRLSDGLALCVAAGTPSSRSTDVFLMDLAYSRHHALELKTAQKSILSERKEKGKEGVKLGLH
jgi:hypothetical protein